MDWIKPFRMVPSRGSRGWRCRSTQLAAESTACATRKRSRSRGKMARSHSRNASDSGELRAGGEIESGQPAVANPLRDLWALLLSDHQVFGPAQSFLE